MKKITKILSGIILFFLLIASINIKADSSIYQDFIDDISASSTIHLDYRNSARSDLRFSNSYIEGYVVICLKENNIYLNLMLINKSKNIELNLYLTETNNELIRKSYSVNGTTYIYGIDITKYASFSLRTLYGNTTISSYEYDTLELRNLLETKGTITNGTASFPENIINETVKDKLVSLIIVIGIAICIILGIVIFVIVKAKKVNIKSEERFTYIYQRKEEPVENSDKDVIDVSYEEAVEEKPSMPNIHDPKYLTELYKKRLNNEISEKEFEAALNRYRTSKDLEDDD